jgi:hypothetical protein
MILRILLLWSLACGICRAADSAPLELEVKIPLPDVHGRIDHLAIDSARQRIFVAELGNDTVGIIDLKERKTLQTIAGLRSPQGIGYVPSTDTLFVANADDGSVRVFQGPKLTPMGQIALGDDADNVRVDDAARRVYVGYGSGALAVIDTANSQRIGDIPLRAHPESFQLTTDGQHIAVNVPNAHEIAWVDRTQNKQTASWPTGSLRSNFPMALDRSRGRALVVFRRPAKLVAFDLNDGHVVSQAETCGDSDDAFFDAKRDRAYIICGEGFIDVLRFRADGYESIARIPTSSGARTGLYSPELDRLMLAVRASSTTSASVWVFRPAP